jgi:hypothetical protein
MGRPRYGCGKDDIDELSVCEILCARSWSMFKGTQSGFREN